MCVGGLGRGWGCAASCSCRGRLKAPVPARRRCPPAALPLTALPRRPAQPLYIVGSSYRPLQATAPSRRPHKASHGHARPPAARSGCTGAPSHLSMPGVRSGGARAPRSAAAVAQRCRARVAARSLHGSTRCAVVCAAPPGSPASPAAAETRCACAPLLRLSRRTAPASSL